MVVLEFCFRNRVWFGGFERPWAIFVSLEVVIEYRDTGIIMCSDNVFIAHPKLNTRLTPQRPFGIH